MKLSVGRENCRGMQEKLLLPALEYAASVDTVKLILAVRLFDREFGLRRSPNERLEDPAGWAFRQVASAFRSLGEAGLLRFASKLGWRITEEGQAALKEEPRKIDCEYLRKIPAYVRHWEQVARDERRRSFVNLRFDFFSGGRALIFQGSVRAAAVLLAYSIEYHLKAAMIEFEESWSKEERRLVERSHDLLQLYFACLSKGILRDTFITADFLRFASDHFEMRYPGKEASLLESVGYWKFGGSFLAAYDDCVLQLDSSLANYYGSWRHSLGTHAISNIRASEQAFKTFFHSNVYAVHLLENYVNAVPRLEKSRIQAEQLSRPDLIFSQEGLPAAGCTIQRAQEMMNWHLAGLFVYPSQDEPDPNPRGLSDLGGAEIPVSILRSKWVVKRLQEKFGPANIRCVEVRESGKVGVHVFDRTARKWCRTLLLKEGFREIFWNRERSREWVESWILETQAQFRRKRRGLRMPPNRRLRKYRI